MIGLADVQIAVAIYGCIAATVIGVIYGVVRWNHTDKKSGER